MSNNTGASNLKLYVSFAIGVIVLIYVMLNPGIFIPTSPTITPTMTFTLLPNTSHIAITRVETGCFDWSYHKITVIESLESVTVLGRNKLGTWLMVRWPKFTTDCWVESNLVKPTNYSLEQLFEISALFPPPLTATSTTTVTATLTQTRVRPSVDPTKTRQSSNDPSDIATWTETPVISPPGGGTTVVPPPGGGITVVPLPVGGTTVVPPPGGGITVVPPPTSTPSRPRDCNDGTDNDGDGKTDYPDDPGCRNSGDDDEG